VLLHNTKEVEQTLQECEFLRFGNIPYSSDLSPCDLFSLVIFMTMKLLSYETIDELAEVITKTKSDNKPS
jgi:hypothetical protein